jgi:uncharacterized protein YbjT (DUF2867 family)
MLLMTGATGTVGREVVRRLSAHGIEVRAVTRDLRHVDAHRLPHVPCVHGDFEDLESMYPAFLWTHSTARAEAQQTAFTRVAHQSGVRHLVELLQFAGRRVSGLASTVLRPHLFRQGLFHFRATMASPHAWHETARPQARRTKPAVR